MTTIYLVHTDDDDGQNYSGYADREKAMGVAREWIREQYDEGYPNDRESALEELEERMSADGWNLDCVRVEEINIIE